MIFIPHFEYDSKKRGKGIVFFSYIQIKMHFPHKLYYIGSISHNICIYLHVGICCIVFTCSCSMDLARA